MSFTLSDWYNASSTNVFYMPSLLLGVGDALVIFVGLLGFFLWGIWNASHFWTGVEFLYLLSKISKLF
jgi:hypothetical protein